MARPRKLNDDAFDALARYGRLAAVGATEALPMEFPDGFETAGVRPRDPSRNTFIGLTVTRPDEDIVAFGLAYHDQAGGHTDEDMYELNVPRRDLTYYGRGSWEKKDPRFRGTHRGDKSYLEKLLDEWSRS